MYNLDVTGRLNKVSKLKVEEHEEPVQEHAIAPVFCHL